ncbi:MAG TPA: hypothetical protein VLE91_00335 [Candidatus Saccharimonadales bacterium]|nr:hypothetical protein [Candidatus Saccharimonadales bacterium]
MATKNSSFFDSLEVYPQVKIAFPKNPNRMWAFPILGGLLKVFILIPVFIWLMLLSIFDFFVIIINSFMVLFSGKYWDYCYQLNLGIMKLWAKVIFFFAGLTDKYPNFDFNTPDFSVDISMPKAPNRLFAIPLLGIFARIILLIPFGIYSTVINNAARIGVVISSFPVFFSGKYPQGTYELTVDAIRLTFAQLSYIVGIKDNYPSFKIDLKNNRTLKIILIILGVLILLAQWTSGDKRTQKVKYLQEHPYQNNYQIPQGQYR